MAKQPSRLVVKLHQPQRVRLIGGILVLALLLGAFALYEYGRRQGGFHSQAAAAERERFIAQLTSLEARNTQLSERIALLDASNQIDAEAYEQVEASLAEFQDEILALRQELAFYRGIVAPADGRSGLRIQEFRVSPGAERLSYRVRLVLIQALEHDRPIKGVVDLMIYGQLDGQSVAFSLPDLTAGDQATSGLAFAFRYFQDFDMDVVLPEGFVPQRVEIEVVPEGKSAKVVRQSSEWTVQSS